MTDILPQDTPGSDNGDVNVSQLPSSTSSIVPAQQPLVPAGGNGDAQQARTHSIRLTATIRTQQSAQPQHPTNNNNGEMPQQTQNLFTIRDRLFLALFFRASLIYVRSVPKFGRRVLEFTLLLQSIILLGTLAYIHVVYTQSPMTCLEEYRDSWPKDGILRVEITTEPAENYSLLKSYAKEERLRQRNAQAQINNYPNDDLLSMMLTADSIIISRAVSTAQALLNTFSIRKSATGTTEQPDSSDSEMSTLEPGMLTSTAEASEIEQPYASGETFTTGYDEERVVVESEGTGGVEIENIPTVVQSMVEPIENLDPRKLYDEEDEMLVPSFVHATASGVGRPGIDTGDLLDNSCISNQNGQGDSSATCTKRNEELLKAAMSDEDIEDKEIVDESDPNVGMKLNIEWIQSHAYIVEYSQEYGFLRLSPQTRQRLNISVLLVVLDPHSHTCFGNNISRFILHHFLGYDDILISSIKRLAENEDNKGYLRNVVTGEQFRFVPAWMARSAYVPALLIMLVFTVSISMLLRYSHHQIFVFIVDLLNNVEGNGSIHIPAAALFTVILALVGMEAVMSEFFNNSSTAFYVILIVWIADQFCSVCIQTDITRKYWVRFFYLYHFVFYAYHYRFNGQHGGLALLTSWSFILHSMIHFYHHYELPAILRQLAPVTLEEIRNPSGGNGIGTRTGNDNRTHFSVPQGTIFRQGSNNDEASGNNRDERVGRGSSPSRRYNITTLSAEISYTTSNPQPQSSSALTTSSSFQNEGRSPLVESGTLQGNDDESRVDSFRENSGLPPTSSSILSSPHPSPSSIGISSYLRRLPDLLAAENSSSPSTSRDSSISNSNDTSFIATTESSSPEDELD